MVAHSVLVRVLTRSFLKFHARVRRRLQASKPSRSDISTAALWLDEMMAKSAEVRLRVRP